jgi:hypothetical protein
MSKLILPGQQPASQVNFAIGVNGEAIVIQVNGLTVPPLTAEAVRDLADKLVQAANHVVANRVPVEPVNAFAIAGG